MRWMCVTVELEFVDRMRCIDHPSQLAVVGYERSCRPSYCCSGAALLLCNECRRWCQVTVCPVA